MLADTMLIVIAGSVCSANVLLWAILREITELRIDVRRVHDPNR